MRSVCPPRSFLAFFVLRDVDDSLPVCPSPHPFFSFLPFFVLSPASAHAGRKQKRQKNDKRKPTTKSDWSALSTRSCSRPITRTCALTKPQRPRDTFTLTSDCNPHPQSTRKGPTYTQTKKRNGDHRRNEVRPPSTLFLVFFFQCALSFFSPTLGLCGIIASRLFFCGRVGCGLWGAQGTNARLRTDDRCPGCGQWRESSPERRPCWAWVPR